MKTMFYFLLLIVFIGNTESKNRIIYTDPRDNARFVNTSNKIVIGFEQPVNITARAIERILIVRTENDFQIPGSVSIVSGGKKIIFKPEKPFPPGEKITVTFVNNPGKNHQPVTETVQFSFFTSSVNLPYDPVKSLNEETGGLFGSGSMQYSSLLFLTVTVNNKPSDGYLFLAPYISGTILLITDKDGATKWYSDLPSFGGDFKKQPNGNLTYFNSGNYTHYEIDHSYDTVNTYMCGNGYSADIHELRVLLNGHAYLIAYDQQVVDMSQIVPGGQTNAIVTGLIIQEIDENKDVVFQWRSWDHFQITDATHENLLAAQIDYAHGNAIEIDNDSNIIISSRNMDEITKINHETGNIIWRLGGKNNQFTFINDSIKFSYQHAIRRIANGNLTLFDNGNYHTPQFSRAIEYSIDEVNKTVTKVWEFRNTPSIYASWGGYVQRLAGGNTLIGWGGTRPSVTEVTPAGTVVFEASFATGIFSYRAYKFQWNDVLPVNNQNSTLPAGYRLEQNYPNPFNPVTKIKFIVPHFAGKSTGMAVLKVYDILGNELQTLINEHLQPGTYEVDFNGSKFASGIYYYSLSAGNYAETKKMALVK